MIPYTYEVVEAGLGGATLLYQSPGYPDIFIGVHTPRQGETLDAIAKMYAPVAQWAERDVVRVPLTVGTKGSFNPVPPIDNRTSLQIAKDDKFAQIAAWRYACEVGGVTMGGMAINTSREAQALLGNAVLSMREGHITSVDWKLASGQFVTLTMAELVLMARAVAVHVQTCFTAEKQLRARVQACTQPEKVAEIAMPEGFL